MKVCAVQGFGASNGFAMLSIKTIVEHCLQESNLILMTAGMKGNTIRFMPSLTVSAAEVEMAVEAISRAIAAVEK